MVEVVVEIETVVAVVVSVQTVVGRQVVVVDVVDVNGGMEVEEVKLGPEGMIRPERKPNRANRGANK